MPFINWIPAHSWGQAERRIPARHRPEPTATDAHKQTGGRHSVPDCLETGRWPQDALHTIHRLKSLVRREQLSQRPPCSGFIRICKIRIVNVFAEAPHEERRARRLVLMVKAFFFFLLRGSDRITPAHSEVKIRQVSAPQHTVKTIWLVWRQSFPRSPYGARIIHNVPFCSTYARHVSIIKARAIYLFFLSVVEYVDSFIRLFCILHMHGERQTHCIPTLSRNSPRLTAILHLLGINMGYPACIPLIIGFLRCQWGSHPRHQHPLGIQGVVSHSLPRED